MIEKKAYIGARIFDGTDEHFGAALLIEKKKILKERRCLQVNYVTFETDWKVE